MEEANPAQRFVLLAKGQKGKGCAAVIQQALSAPALFHFAELLDLPSVQELENSEKATFQLLRTFAFGTYQEYKAAKDLPELTPPQLTKLRQLTVVSLSAEMKVIPYALLLKQLELSNVRELEDLIIDCIYAGLVRGKLDQKDSQLEVDFAISRDLRPGQIEHVIKTLNEWCNRSQGLLKDIESKVSYANRVHESQVKQKKHLDDQIEEAKKTLKTMMEADMSQNAEFGMYEDDRGGRKKGHGHGGHGVGGMVNSMMGGMMGGNMMGMMGGMMGGSKNKATRNKGNERGPQGGPSGKRSNNKDYVS